MVEISVTCPAGLAIQNHDSGPLTPVMNSSTHVLALHWQEQSGHCVILAISVHLSPYHSEFSVGQRQNYNEEG